MCNDEVPARTEVEALVDRRCRRFTAEEKRQILEEMFRPGANISRLARQHGTSPGVLFRWRKRAREGSLMSIHDCGFYRLDLASQGA
jgi:transposase